MKSTNYRNIIYNECYSKSQKIHNALKLHFIYHGQLPKEVDNQRVPYQLLGLAESDTFTDKDKPIKYHVINGQKIELAYLDIHDKINIHLTLDPSTREVVIEDFDPEVLKDGRLRNVVGPQIYKRLSIKHSPIAIGNVKICKTFEILDQPPGTYPNGCRSLSHMQLPMQIQHVHISGTPPGHYRKGIIDTIQFQIQIQDLNHKEYKQNAYSLDSSNITYDQLLLDIYPTIRLSTEIRYAKLKDLERLENSNKPQRVRNIFYCTSLDK